MLIIARGLYVVQDMKLVSWLVRHHMAIMLGIEAGSPRNGLKRKLLTMLGHDTVEYLLIIRHVVAGRLSKMARIETPSKTDAVNDVALFSASDSPSTHVGPSRDRSSRVSKQQDTRLHTSVSKRSYAKA